MITHNLPVRLQSEGYITIPAREGGTGDFWYVTVLFIPLIGYLTYVGLEIWNPYFSPFMLLMPVLLGWFYFTFFGPTLRFIIRRSRGYPGLHIDESGLYGSVIDVRGGRLVWDDILAVDFQTSEHSMYRGISIAVSDRVRANKGLRYRREVTPLVEMLPIDAQLTVPLLQTAHDLWGSKAHSPLLVDGRPVNLVTDDMAQHDARMRAIERGESVAINYRAGRMRTQLWFGIPFLLVCVAALLGLPIWMWTDVESWGDEVWALWVMTVIFIPLALLSAVLIGSIFQRWRRARSGVALYILDERGLHEPSRGALRSVLPWTACEFAFVRHQSRAPDMVMLKVIDIEKYLRSDRFYDVIGKKFRSWFQKDRLPIEYNLAGMRPDEMCDLLNQAIFRWGRR